MGLLKAFVLAVSVATVARAGLAYLPVTGPLPLRMQVVKSAPLKAETVAGQFPSETKPDAALANLVSSADTTSPVAIAATNIFPALPPVSIGAGNVLDDTFGTAIFALPMPELMGLTPQMLALYFHPAGNGTNAALVGPFHVGFIPPLLPSEKSSHAEYIVK